MCSFRISQRNIIVATLIILMIGVPVSLRAGRGASSDADTDSRQGMSIFSGIDSSVNALITSIASKKAEKVADAPGVISILTHDELVRFGGTTLRDIVARVPSILETTFYLTERSAIASRGDQVVSSSSHILLLINGRPIREILEGGIKSELYESFPVNAIDRIEVIRGPGSVLYGSQAISAVINVITKSPDEQALSVSAAVGEGGRNNIMADLQYQTGNFGMFLAGRYANKGDWKTTWKAPGLSEIYTNDVSIPNNGPGMYAEVSYLDKKYLNFRWMGSFCQWDTRYYVPDYQYLADIPESGVTEVSSWERWRKYFSDIGYSMETIRNYRLQVNMTLTRSWLETHGTFPSLLRDSYEMIGEVTNSITPIENCNVVVGGVWGSMTGSERNNRIDSIVMNEGHYQNTFSAYVQVDYHCEWYKIIGGLQVNKVANFKVDQNPRAGVIFYPFENIDIKVLYSTAFRAPSLNELYLDHIEMKGKMNGEISPAWDGDKTNDGVLDPEKIRTFDVGFNYSDEKTGFGLNAFHSNMKNLIFQDRSDKWVHATYENIGEVTFFGLECEGKCYLTKNLLFEASFLYQQSKDEYTGEQNVAPLPNFSVKGGISYRSSGLVVSAFNTFRQGLDPKYSSDLNPAADYFNMANIHCSFDISHLLGLSVVRGLSLVLTIDNLLDEEVWLPAWGLKIGSTIPVDEGRKVYGGFTVTF